MSEAVLVTGGGGFIGTWVLKELLRIGARPVVVDLQPGGERWRRVLGKQIEKVVFAPVALTDRDALQSLLESHGVTRVIHLAALLTPACQHDPWIGFDVNVRGSMAVFDAARRSGTVRSIALASSYAVYGPEKDSDANRPTHFYGAFKQSVDLLADQYWRHFQIPSLAIRPHVVYGPERDQGLTAGPSLACKAAATGEAYRIGYTGRANYDYVDDVARAFVRAAFECPPGANVVDLIGEPASVDDFIRAIEVAAPGARMTSEGPPIPASIPPKPNSIANLFSDWRMTSLIEGVRNTVDFYRESGT